MVGVQHFMMLVCGVWFLLIGAGSARSYGWIATAIAALAGLIAGVIVGLIIAEIDTELTLRTGRAREQNRTAVFVVWLVISLVYWAAIFLGLFLPLRLVPQG